MSFSSDVKQELAQVPVLSDCCAQARAYGMLLFGRMFSVSEISFATENENIARFYCDVIKELFGITPSLSSGVSKYTVSVPDEADRKRILEFFGHSESDISLRINRANLPEDCCFGSFLRGVFIACGTVSSPEKTIILSFPSRIRDFATTSFNCLTKSALSRNMSRESRAISSISRSARK